MSPSRRLWSQCRGSVRSFSTPGTLAYRMPILLKPSREPTTIVVPAKAGTHFSARGFFRSGHHRRNAFGSSKVENCPRMDPGLRRDDEVTGGISDGGSGDRTEGTARGGCAAVDG